jgi:hypothetical protein
MIARRTDGFYLFSCSQLGVSFAMDESEFKESRRILEIVFGEHDPL